MLLLVVTFSAYFGVLRIIWLWFYVEFYVLAVWLLLDTFKLIPVVEFVALEFVLLIETGGGKAVEFDWFVGFGKTWTEVLELVFTLALEVELVTLIFREEFDYVTFEETVVTLAKVLLTLTLWFTVLFIGLATVALV